MNLVHGTDGELVAPDWPPLDLPGVQRVLRALGLEATGVRWRSPRPLSAAGIVDTRTGPVLVKRHADTVRTLEGLDEEHALAVHVRSRGVPVPRHLGPPVADGPWTYEVQALGEGEDRYRDVPSWRPFATADDARATGAALARLSLAAQDHRAPGRRPQVLVAGWECVSGPDLLAGVRGHVDRRPLLQRALAGRDWERDVARVLGPLHDRLVPHLPALAPGWTHGDGHPSNLLWSANGRVRAVLDLGLADRTTPLLDLATAVERGAVSWLDPHPVARLDLVGALVHGWHEVRPLTPAEAAALPELLPLVHVDLALSETAYYAELVGSAAGADLAYEGYLLGHARWATTAAGAALRRRLSALTAQLSSSDHGPS